MTGRQERKKYKVDGNPLGAFVCTHCKTGNCNKCIDIMRVAAGLRGLACGCTAVNHTGEPISNQILDPETGSVHAPGMEVTKGGDVIRRD